MKTVTEVITPDKAKSLLSRNTTNRNLSANLVAKYAKQMRSGEWSLTHQGIAVYDDGELADGQHRLNAVIASGCDVVMQVTYGISRESGCDIDVHRARNISDSIKIGGLSDWIDKDVIAIVRKVTKGGDRMTTREIVAVGEKYRSEIDFVLGLFPTKKKTITSAPVLAAMVSALVHGESRARLSSMAHCLATGVVDGVEDIAAIRLREYAISNPGANRGAATRSDLFMRSQRAIKAYCDSEAISKLYLPKDLIYPQVTL